MNKVALVMIVRDEARGLARCLDSVRPWVDELVVMDTGSRDATPEIARRAGARVAHFKWIDDFAAARNAALDAADADWALVLDGDEWLVGGGEYLHGLRTQPPDHLGLVSVASEFDDRSGVQVSRNAMPRLLPRGVRYAGRVHEQPVGDLARRLTPLQVQHDGYREAQRQGKRGRNLRLLEAELQAAPGDPYVLYQQGTEHAVAGDHRQAWDCFAPALQAAPAGARYRHDLVVRSLFSLKQVGQHADAVQLAEQEMAQWAHSPDFHFALGDLLLDWAAHEPQRAGELLPMIEAAWRHCLALGERPDLEGAVQGRGSHLAAYNLAVLFEGTGRAQEAQAMRALARPPKA